MKLILFIVLIASGFAQSQDLQIRNNPYDNADEVTKNKKSFNRERWFYEQRMYPYNFIPADAYEKALDQKNEMNKRNGFAMNGPFSAWTNLGPTTGFYFNYSNISSRVSTVKYDPNNGNIIYIGTAFGGVWKSTNGGVTWTAKSDNEVSLSSGSIAIDPSNSNIIYYGTGETTYSTASYYGRGVLKSTNGGDTWASYTAGLPSTTYTSRLVIRPNYPGQLLAAMGTGGLFRSTDGGVSWNLLVSGRCDDVVFSPTGDSAYIVGSGTGYRASYDGGASFTSIAGITLGTRNHLAICKAAPNVIYCSVYTGTTIKIYKSVNAGATFTQIVVGQNFSGSQAWYDFYMHVNQFDPNIAYVGSIDIWRTTNGGATNFTNLTNTYIDGNVHADQQNADFHPTDPNQMLCSNDGGIWKSTNKGTTWINMNTNQTLTQFYRIATDPSNANHIMGGTQDNGTQRTLGTINWTAAFGGDGAEVCFHAKNNSYILGEAQNNLLQRSTDGGATWTPATTGLTGTGTWVSPIVSHPDSNGIFYTARSLVFKTVDWGATWFPISSGTSGTIREMAISKSSPNVLYVTAASAVYRSTNRGYSFTLVSSGMPTRNITSVNVHPDSSQVVVVTFSGFGAGKIYKTTNGGTNWINISGNLPDSPVNDALIYYPGYSTSTYFTATDVGVFISNDFGGSWTELANGLPNTVAMHLDYHAVTNKLRLGTHGRGVYELNLNPTSIVLQVTAIPQGFYNNTTGKMNIRDTIDVFLRSNEAPYAAVDSASSVMDSVTFTSSFTFTNAASGTYYIMLRHRNSIETWSKPGGVYLTSGMTSSYDFTSSASQAYGDNMVLNGTKYCLYNGDIDQSDMIELSDIISGYNDAAEFLTGYSVTDVTGNNLVDLNDVLLIYNNASKFVTEVLP